MIEGQYPLAATLTIPDAEMVGKKYISRVGTSAKHYASTRKTFL
ncbi:hypothetical protein RRV45_04845 [Bacillus sp. DTU_2020_1000418_1_SI_GHA_SEK_038]|nr:hypothetical protein [Bacillus sp. DTU_2020_1000418_1_SI_GHA_SEK_038]WNS76340.1 hypothetical protein RRV45_04845 [Bacillus sp. DTU_2020_1000418_1_SI_GHA_SEK_038]